MDDSGKRTVKFGALGVSLSDAPHLDVPQSPRTPKSPRAGTANKLQRQLSSRSQHGDLRDNSPKSGGAGAFQFSKGYQAMLSRQTTPAVSPKRGGARAGSNRGARNAYEGLNLGVLMRLRESFFQKDLVRGDALSLDAFLDAFRKVTNTQLREDELVAMFMKIDANSDGTVDWDEFTNFLLLVDEGARAMQEAALEQDLLPAADLRSPPAPHDQHRGLVDAVVAVEWPTPCFVTAGRDGWLRFWHYNTLAPLRQIQHQVHHARMMGSLLAEATGAARIRMAAAAKDQAARPCRAWVTALCYLPLSCRLAVACIDRSVTFYDLTNYERACRIGHLDHVPTALAWQYVSQNQQVLAVGDQGGLLHVYALERAFHFSGDGGGGGPGGGGGGGGPGGGPGGGGHPASAGGAAGHHHHGGPAAVGGGGGGGGGGGAAAGEGDARPNAFGYGVLSHNSFELHRDWVTRAKYVRELDLLLTSSLDSKVKLFDLNKLEFQRAFRGHKKGVYSFEFCKVAKIVASVGMNRQALIWNPYTLDVIASLTGHGATILEVAVDENNQRIVTLSEDKMVICWDIGTFKKSQVFTDTSDYRPENTATAMLWDGAQDLLLTAGNYLTGWRTKKTIKRQEHSHEAPLCAALYQPTFNVVVSADTGSTVQVWNIKNGTIQFRFANAHGGSKITAMAFDASGRRLVTGAHDGSVHMWNYNNGQCIKTYGDRAGVGGAGERPGSSAAAAEGAGGHHHGHEDQMSNEVTALLYVDKKREPHPGGGGGGGGRAAGGGGGAGGTQFVISCGWDRKVRVFLDQDVGAIRPMRVMPGPCSVGHKEDILCMAYCPPNHLATGSQDGTIIVWGLDTGFPRFTLHACDYDDGPASAGGSLDAVDVLNDAWAHQAALDRARRRGRGGRLHEPEEDSDKDGADAAGSSGSSSGDESWVDSRDGGADSDDVSAVTPHEAQRGAEVVFDGDFQKKVGGAPHIGKLAGAGFGRTNMGNLFSGAGHVNQRLSPAMAAKLLNRKNRAKKNVDRRAARRKEATAGRRIRGAAHLILGMQGAMTDQNHGTPRAHSPRRGRLDSKKGKKNASEADNKNTGQKRPIMRPVEAMLYLQNQGTLLTTGTDAKIRCWRIRDGSLIHWAPSKHPDGHGLTALATDAGERYLLTGCGGGHLKVWQIRSMEARGGARLHRRRSMGGGAGEVNQAILAHEALRPLRIWQAHQGSVVSAQFCDHVDEGTGKGGRLVLTAGSDGDVSLWTPAGHHIGIFGGATQWKLDSLASWKSPHPAEVLNKEAPDNITPSPDNKEDARRAAEQAAATALSGGVGGSSLDKLRRASRRASVLSQAAQGLGTPSSPAEAGGPSAALRRGSRRASLTRRMSFARGMATPTPPQTAGKTAAGASGGPRQRRPSLMQVDQLATWERREEARERELKDSRENQAHMLYFQKKQQLQRRLVKDQLARFVLTTGGPDGRGTLEEDAQEAGRLLAQTRRIAASAALGQAAAAAGEGGGGAAAAAAAAATPRAGGGPRPPPTASPAAPPGGGRAGGAAGGRRARFDRIRRQNYNQVAHQLRDQELAEAGALWDGVMGSLGPIQERRLQRNNKMAH